MDVNISNLIFEIKSRPAIWDRFSMDYKDKDIRRKCWEELSAIFSRKDCTEHERYLLTELLQKKWKNVRDRYAREVHKANKKSGKGRARISRYKYRKQLSFLDDILNNRKSSSTTKYEEYGLLELEEDSLSEESVDANASEIEERNEIVLTPIIEEPFIPIKMENNPVEKFDSTEDKQTNEDDDKLFFLSLLPSMKNISKHLKLSARMEIMQVVDKYNKMSSTM